MWKDLPIKSMSVQNEQPSVLLYVSELLQGFFEIDQIFDFAGVFRIITVCPSI
jgi:hypothetical protein